MKRTLTLAGLLATVLLLPALALGAGGMQPGLWELAITVDVNGRAQTVPASRECISQLDIDGGNRTLPRPDGCSVSNVERSSDRATYDLACTQGTLATRGKADIRFSEDRYDGKVDMTMAERGGQNPPLVMIIAAKRVGACSK